jgi:CRP/FNR family transcriptional regulator, cyclic AMP receptor protein
MAGSVAASRIPSPASPSVPRRAPIGFRKASTGRPCGALLMDGRFHPALSPEAWSDLLRIRHMIALPAGETVFVERQACRGVYILCKGRAKLSIANSEGKTLIVRIAGPGEILALNACLSGQCHDMTLETTLPSEFAFVHTNEFLQFIGEHKDASCLAGEQLIRDCRGAYDLVRSVGLAQNITERLARFLLEWAVESRSSDGALYLKFRFTHDEIAQMIGATRETVTRALGLLKRERVIEFSHAGLLIRDVTALKHMVN